MSGVAASAQRSKFAIEDGLLADADFAHIHFSLIYRIPIRENEATLYSSANRSHTLLPACL